MVITLHCSCSEAMLFFLSLAIHYKCEVLCSCLLPHLLYSAKFENEWSYTSTLQCAFLVCTGTILPFSLQWNVC